jgi:YVTN family beta-propeller protein
MRPHTGMNTPYRKVVLKTRWWLGLAMAVVSSLALLGSSALPADAMFGPAAVAVSPDGQRIYVSFIAEDTILALSASTYQAVGLVGVDPRVESTTPAAAVSPDGTRVYFTRFTDVDAHKKDGSLLVIDSTANKLLATVPVGVLPSAVAVSPDGRWVYVANEYSGSVSVIDTASNQVSVTVIVGGAPSSLAFSPDGARVYVAGTTGDPSDRNRGRGTVSVIDTAAGQVTAHVSVDDFPRTAAVSPDGKRIYVTHVRGPISVIDTATNSLVGVVKGAREPGAATVSPDGKRVYVGDDFLGLLTIDTASDQIIARLETATYPTALAVSPDGTRIYVGRLDTFTLLVIDSVSDQVLATVVLPH